jgi:hypothetical protein
MDKHPVDWLIYESDIGTDKTLQNMHLFIGVLYLNIINAPVSSD